ncbi:MAG: MarC family protein, partial [Alcaligenaceae bacterium]|nr:MarC family protein [Alcaligenaceae bacterium]
METSLFFDFSRSFLFTIATLLPMLNPPAAAPIFLTLTEGASTSARTR